LKRKKQAAKSVPKAKETKKESAEKQA